MPLKGFVKPNADDLKKYVANDWWLDLTLGELVDRAAEAHPDKEALVEGDNRLTYRQLKDSIDKVAVGLVKSGIEPGDRVMLQLPNWLEFAFAFFALHKIGAKTVMLLPRHKQVEINHLCSQTGATAWILPGSYRSTDYRPVVEDVRRENRQLKQIINVRGLIDPSFIDFDKLVNESELNPANLEELKKRRPDPAEAAVILATGGTTGLPKIVPRIHYSAVCEARFKMVSREQTENDSCLIAVPLEHNLGLAGFTSTIYSYGRVVLLDSTRIEDICSTIASEKITCSPIVPTLLARLAEYEDLEKHDLSSLRALYVGGAKTARETIETIHRRIGRVYTCAFGMSEGATCTTKLSDSDDIVFNTIGRPCCPYDDFRTVSESGEILPRGQEGELQAKGPTVFTGYLDNPEENRRAFTSDGYFSTGDMALIGEDGIISITGRIKDIIIRGGENISPSEMENLILQHPDVADVVVIGLPDKVMGERACACVIPKGDRVPTLEDIVAFLKGNGASVLQLPERLEIIDEVPLTNIGKPDKKTLQKAMIEKLGLANELN